MDTTKRPNLQLVREAGIETTTATANSEEDWIEEIDESTLPPNAWQCILYAINLSSTFPRYFFPPQFNINAYANSETISTNAGLS